MSLMFCRSALLLIALGAALVRAQSADDVVRETQRLKAQIEQERRMASADSARQAEWRRQSRERLATMRAEAQRLARERDSLRGFVDRRLSAPPPPPPRTASAAASRKAFAAAVAARIDAFLPRLVAPEAASTRSDLEGLSRSLKAGKTDASEGLSRLFDAWAEGLDAAARLAVRPGTHTTGSGRAVRGNFLSVGGLMEAFVDREGDYAAVRSAAGWEEIPDVQVRLALRDACAKVSGSDGPGWAWIPVAPGARP